MLDGKCNVTEIIYDTVFYYTMMPPMVLKQDSRNPILDPIEVKEIYSSIMSQAWILSFGNLISD